MWHIYTHTYTYNCVRVYTAYTDTCHTYYSIQLDIYRVMYTYMHMYTNTYTYNVAYIHTYIYIQLCACIHRIYRHLSYILQHTITYI